MSEATNTGPSGSREETSCDTAKTSISSRIAKNTLERARGLLAGSIPPPTDEEVQQWLEQRRLAKYSGPKDDR